MVGFHNLRAWVLLCAAAPLAASAAIAHAAATPSDRQHAVAEELLVGDNMRAQIVAALQAETASAQEGVPHSVHLSLANIGLPVPPEIRDMASKANGGKGVTAADADRAAATLNKMLEEQHLLLDHKVIHCREIRRSTGEAIQSAAAEVRNLASETSSARGIIVEATSRIPQDRRSFEEFKAEAQISRSRCQEEARSDTVQTGSLARNAAVVGAVQDALKRQCTGHASLLQEPGDEVDDIIANAEKSIQDVDAPEPMGLSQSMATEQPNEEVDEIIAGAEGALHGKAVVDTKAVEAVKDVVAFHGKVVVDAKALEAVKDVVDAKALEAGGCPAIAAALGVVARKRGGHAAVALLQELQPVKCKMTKHNCAAMLDVAEEVAGEIADSQARLKASSARGRDACKEEDLFGKNQLAMETSQASDRSRELGEATWRAGQVGDLANQKDKERQQKQKELKAITGKCTAEIKSILYGKMCALQKLRDGLQILAGRTELPEDCQVTDWDAGVCSATCGGGVKTLTRKVLLAPKGGAACPPLTLQLHCGETACPKDCEISGWSGFSACSARCDGGVQERNRHVTTHPVGNGAGCPHLVDMRLCNSEACTSECELLQWTSWSPCSRACGAGTKARRRGLRDEGKTSCPSSESKDRFELEECNAKTCGNKNDVQCAGAPMDMVLLLDASGSMTEEGFGTVKALSLELVRDYALRENATKLSVATFAKQATAISGLTADGNELQSKLTSKLRWLKGPGNAASGLSRAAALMAAGGRKNAMSVVLMVTDGRLVDPYLARQAADRLKKSGIRLAFALVGTDYRNTALLKSMASAPDKDNFIQLPDFEQLASYVKWSSKQIITGTCSAVV